jgi:alcohol dehydrogenase class IV
MTIDLETFFNTPATQRFSCPATLVWGPGCRERLVELAADAGTAALWVDEHFAAADVVVRLREQLGERLVAETVVHGMPLTTEVDAAVEAGAGRVDVVVAIGGGSTIDAAKAAIAQRLYGTYDGVGMGDLRGMPVLPDATRPLLVCVPTTAGTGAEVSRYYVTYDSASGTKVHGKSWRLIADWVLLDPVVLRHAPAALLVGCAFDAFVHCWESFLCRGERSWFNEMLSVEGMSRVVCGLEAVAGAAEPDLVHLMELQYAAAIGGIAISNVRTGNIHEAAGALLEHSRLTHPETLYVFWREAVEQYGGAIADRLARLLPALAATAPQAGISDLESLLAWWDQRFAGAGLDESVRAGLGRVGLPAGELERHIYDRVHADRVWADKESPVPLSDADIEYLVSSSLTRFGYRSTGE